MEEDCNDKMMMIIVAVVVMQSQSTIELKVILFGVIKVVMYNNNYNHICLSD